MKNTAYPDSATIELLVEANPGRRGTKAHEYFEIARMCPDIRAYRDAGGSLPYLYWLKGPREAGDCCLSRGGPILADRAPRGDACIGPLGWGTLKKTFKSQRDRKSQLSA
jgi:hypothetical protein